MQEFKISNTPVPYDDAIAFMEARVAAIRDGREPECVWLLEHPPLYTAGTSAKDGDLLDARFPVFKTGRGGEYTYHGPGQRVVYVMLDLKKRQQSPDLKKFIWQLEEWIILSLAECGITGERREGRVGIWVSDMIGQVQQTTSPLYPPSLAEGGGKGYAQAYSRGAGEQGFSEKKIAAIGVRVRRWVTYHGISININPDLSHFSGIVPCGISEYGVTSFKQMGKDIELEAIDAILKEQFKKVF